MAKTSTDYKSAIERSVVLRQYGLCFALNDAEFNNIKLAIQRSHDVDVYRQTVKPTATHPGCILVLTNHLAKNDLIATAIHAGGTIYRPEHHDRTK